MRGGKQPLFTYPFRQLKPEAYRELPTGWSWPPTPPSRDFTPPRGKKRKKRIPQEVLDEWRLWSKPKPKARPLLPEGALQASADATAAARNPTTGELEPGALSDADSAAGEAWADMNPFNNDPDELGLGDPA